MGQALVNGLAEGSIYAVLAIGLVFIFKITEVANFAQGEIAMVAAFVAFTVLERYGVPLPVGLLAGVVAGGLAGYAMERIAIRPLLGTGRMGMGALGPAVVTLGLYFVLHGTATVVWGPDVHPFPSVFGGDMLTFGGLLVSRQHLAIMVASLLTAVALSAFLRYTDLGLAMRCIPQNRYAARLIGLDVPRLYGLTWTIGAAVSAMGGILLAPIVFLNTNMMTDMTNNAFAVAVLGGLGSLVGAFVGALILGIVKNVGVLYLPTEMKESMAFVIVLAVLLVRPEGLFGKPQPEKI